MSESVLLVLILHDICDMRHDQGGNPFGSRGTTSSGAFGISALRPATGLGLERREASAAPKKAQEGEGSEFLGA
jgi:hypothetical protein